MLKKMSFLVLLLIGITFTKCDHNLVAPVAAVIDEPFWLKLGEEKLMPPEDLVINFDQLITDFRCPLGVVCVIAGHAEIQLSLWKDNSDSAIIKLIIGVGVTKEDTTAHQFADTLGYRVKLMQLDPHPNINKRHNLSDYKALLKISKLL
jgi:hypothetical protein